MGTKYLFEHVVLTIMERLQDSLRLYENLVKNEELSGVTFFPKDKELLSFRLKFDRPVDDYSYCEIHGLVVSYPHDRDGLIIVALLGEFPFNGNTYTEGASLIFDNDIGYAKYDVLEFEGINELIKEIHRISDYISYRRVNKREVKKVKDEKDEKDEKDAKDAKEVYDAYVKKKEKRKKRDRRKHAAFDYGRNRHQYRQKS